MSENASQQKSARGLGNYQIIILGLCIVAGTIAGSVIFSKGFLSVTRFFKQNITVTGSANLTIASDLGTWRCSIERQGAVLADVYRALQGDQDKVRKFLAANGIPENDIQAGLVSTHTLYRKDKDGNESNEPEGYRLSQGLHVTSTNIALLATISKKSEELIEQGIQFDSCAPQYFYTKLDDVKVEMLAKATENARSRARNMVEAAGNKLGYLHSARMGVFQITPVNSTEVSDSGICDTSSIEKKITAVVSAEFAVE